MSFESETLAMAGRNAAPGNPASFSEAAGAAFRIGRQQRQTFSADSSLFDRYEEVRRDAEGRDVATLFNPYAQAAPDRPAAELRFHDELDKLRADHPDLPHSSPQEIRLEIGDRRRLERADAQAVQRRTVGFFPGMGEFAGNAGAALVDPPVLATMFLGAPAASGIIRGALIDAGIQTAAEIPVQAGVQLGRRKFGEKPDLGEAAESIAGAGVGGFAISGLIRTAGLGLRRMRRGEFEAVSAPGVAGEATDVADARAYLRRQDELMASDPFLGGRAEHVERLSEAQRALNEGRAIDLPAPRAPVGREALTRPDARTLYQDEGQQVVADLAAEARAKHLDVAARTESQKAAVLSLRGIADDPAKLAEAMAAIGDVGKRPESLFDTLVAAGGLKPDAELAAIGITARTRPGLISNEGRSLDHAREWAAERGFLPHGTYISDFLNMLDEEANVGRVFRPGDQLAAEEHAARADMAEALASMGLDVRRTSPEALATALREAAAKLDAPDLGTRARAAESRAVDYEAEERAALADDFDSYVARKFDDLAEDIPFNTMDGDGNIRRVTVAEARAEMAREADDFAALQVCMGGGRG